MPVDPDALHNMELGDVLDLLGRPTATVALGGRRKAVAWQRRGRLIEIVFDEHARAERVLLT